MTDEPNHPIRLEDLVAHAEGRLPPGSELRARVEQHLHHHPGDAARVEAWRRQDELLREAYDGIAQQPLPSRLQERLQQPQRPQPRLALAASLVIGLVAGWLVAQIEYAPEGADGGGSLAEQTAEQLSGTNETVDDGETLLPGGAPDLSSIGLTATGNTALEDPSAGLRRHEYRDADGRTLQLLVTRDPMIDPASVYTLRNGDFTLAYWHQGDNTYLLSGAIEPERLQALAHETMTALEPGSPWTEDNDESADSGVVAGNRNDNAAGEKPVVEEVADPVPVVDQM